MANGIKIGNLDISAFKVGSGDCTIYLGDTLLYPTTPSLPSGYTEVEYIQNTSTAYIDTNLQLYSSTTNSFEVEAKLIAAKHDSSTYQNVFSCMSEDGEPYQGFTYRYTIGSLEGLSLPSGQNTFTIVNNEDSTQTVTVTSSTSQRTYTHTYPLTLFCGLNSSRNPFRWTNSKFYYCKVKMNDELVRDLVPCKRDSDDKYGMYDMVSKTFLTSPNNANFVGGTQPQTLQWVTFSNGDTIPSDLQIYGIKGIVNDLWIVFSDYSDNILFEPNRNKYNAIFGGFYNPCYNEVDIISNTSVEYIFSNIGCSDSYTVSGKTIANMSNDIQLYIYA